MAGPLPVPAPLRPGPGRAVPGAGTRTDGRTRPCGEHCSVSHRASLDRVILATLPGLLSIRDRTVSVVRNCRGPSRVYRREHGEGVWQ
ncbi:hypothetical protein GCM10009663_12570 [Kitasatospora arboriphila]|uniref:Uncharacterized protein n=1 Tax=Kitasatospora arboriphila TaxID=258052 RepID=A0ABP4DV96_9ACTN